jgi:galactokinase
LASRAITETVATAHGRVNLIGEHTDYNGGFVLPAVIPQSTRIELHLRHDKHVHIHSRNLPADQANFDYDLGAEACQKHWADYIQGVTWLLAREGFALKGFDCAVNSSVPMGSGLSSSAALEVSLLKALNQLFSLGLNELQIAQLGQKVENEFVGARVGIMDQMAASIGILNEALFIDTRDLSFRRIALPFDAMELIVINSGIAHSNAFSAYNERRAQCEEACRLLGVSMLRDLTTKDLPKLDVLPEVIKRRARHVITENERVVEAVKAIEGRKMKRLGELFTLSHQSMRNDYETSIPEIDQLVEIANSKKEIWGARLTGGGFGGSIVALCRPGKSRKCAREIQFEFNKLTGSFATVLVPEPEVHAAGWQPQAEARL